jgi:hypothetical protein
MIQRSLTFLVPVVAMMAAAPAHADVLCKTRNGGVHIRTACKIRETAVDPAQLSTRPTCPPDSVKSGSICIDKFEASLWQIPPSATTVIQHLQDGTVTLAELTGAGATQLSLATTWSSPCTPAIPGTFPLDANYTAPLYAVSVSDVMPTACISAYQADAACRLSMKRLASNSEWTQAAEGTPRAFTDDGSTSCNLSTAGMPLNTGSRSACVSTAGAFDMLGNIWEWTQDPGAWFRGGSWDTGSAASVLSEGVSSLFGVGNNVGFRCVR